jgi:DNA-binding NarL/FixJ family response regulator
VMAGGAPMSASIARKVVRSFQAAAPHGAESADLSPREVEVLQALAEGLSYKQIADQINVSIHTVRNYIRRVYEKLHVRSRTEAVVKYLKT